MKQNLIITIVWKSWSWKTEIANRLERIFKFNRPKNLTTRPQRPWEENNTDYIHVNQEEFFTELKNNNLVEYVYFWWNFYGIRNPEGDNIIIAEPLWAIQIKKYCFEHNIKNVIIKIECDNSERLRRIWEDEKRKNRKEEYFDLFDSLYDYKLDNTGSLEDSIKTIETYINNLSM